MKDELIINLGAMKSRWDIARNKDLAAFMRLLNTKEEYRQHKVRLSIETIEEEKEEIDNL